MSADRVETELLRLAAEPSARGGFELLDAWGLLALEADAGDLIDAVVELMEREPWRSLAEQALAVHAAATGHGPGAAGRLRDLRQGARELAAADPGRPSEAVELARGRSDVELVLARAMGADWLDDYVGSWRHVGLDISGEDLLAAGFRRDRPLAVGSRRHCARNSTATFPGATRSSSWRLRLHAIGGPSLWRVKWREREGARWLEAELDGARAVFTTRLGGVSDVPFESLNLGLLTGDRPAAVRTNRHRVAATLGLEPDRILIGRQVHGSDVQVRDEPRIPTVSPSREASSPRRWTARRRRRPAWRRSFSWPTACRWR